MLRPILLICSFIWISFGVCFCADNADSKAIAPASVGGNVFHGFYYTFDTQLKALVKLDLTVEQSATFKKVLATGLKPLSEEKYWRSFGRFMTTQAPQGYIAWNGKTYWIVLLPGVNDNHKYVKGTQGLHVIEFSKDQMQYMWLECKDDLPDDINSLVYTPWDWHLDGDHREKQKPLTDAQKKVLGENIDWTDELHKRMNKKFPSENEWKE